MGITALCFTKYVVVATTLANAPDLNISAERALGLHGAAKAAGFIMFFAPMRQGPDESGALKDSKQNGAEAERCQYNVITGRPLPPLALSRRCIVSGLLAAEKTQQKSDALNMNMASRWALESPFCGRRARAVRLERFRTCTTLFSSLMIQR